METFYLSAIVSIGLSAIVFAFLAKRAERLSFRTIFWTTILLFPLPIFMAAGHVGGGMGFLPGIIFFGGLLYLLFMSLVELDIFSFLMFLIFSIVPSGFLFLVYSILKRKFKSTQKPFNFKAIFILLGIEALFVLVFFIAGKVEQSFL